MFDKIIKALAPKAEIALDFSQVVKAIDPVLLALEKIISGTRDGRAAAVAFLELNTAMADLIADFETQEASGRVAKSITPKAEAFMEMAQAFFPMLAELGTGSLTAEKGLRFINTAARFKRIVGV